MTKSPGKTKLDNITERTVKQAPKKGTVSRSVRRKAIEQVISQRLINPVKKPRYDKTYYDGMTWLDSLADS